jgi:hypothetical protein
MEGVITCDGHARLPCKYGQKCYQKNPLHHQKYKHPQKRKLEVSYSFNNNNNNVTPWVWFASELYRPSDLCLSAKLVPIFADRSVSCGQHGRSYGCNHGFLCQSRNFSSSSSVVLTNLSDPVPDPLFSENLVAEGIEHGHQDL